jgi:hypothetical protein
MGFPLIMYLSRSKAVAIWPELDRKDSEGGWQGIKSSLNLSISPKFDISTEWKKRSDQPAPVRGGSVNWPPPDTLQIAVAIEDHLREKNCVGTMSQFLDNSFEYPTYKLWGSFRLDEASPSIAWLPIKVHAITGRLRIADTNQEVSLTLALENIPGVDFQEGEWHAWESGAHWFFKEASSKEGYPLAGLFTYEGNGHGLYAACGAVYFVSLRTYQADKSYLRPQQRDTLGEGLPSGQLSM